ncbi:MAG: carboxypeptidase regulatory-like domain-containing protein [Bdellovibrionales bacterium]|nr:carboxypeptidase regulatory-like domain-containing protein [Bdellovibrionales bacterium]
MRRVSAFIVMTILVLGLGLPIVSLAEDSPFNDFYTAFLTTDESDSGGFGNGVSMDLLQDEPVLSFYGKTLPNSERHVHFASWNISTHSWDVETVTTLVGLGYVPWTARTSLVVRNGRPHIFFSGANNQLLHAVKENGSWVTEAITVEGAGGQYPSAVSLDSGFAVCFKDQVTNALWVAEGTGGSWTTTKLEADDSNTGNNCHIARKASGEPAVVSNDQNLRIPRFVEKTNGAWLPPVSLEQPSTNASGQYPFILVRANGDIYVFYRYANAEPNDGSLRYLIRAGGGGAWSAGPSLNFSSSSSYIGAYPYFIERASGLLFGAIRRRMSSALFGQSTGIVRYEERADGNDWAGYNIFGSCSKRADVSYINVKEDSAGNIFVVGFDPSCAYGSKDRVVVLSRMANGGAAPGIGAMPFSVTVKDTNGNLVVGAEVTLFFGGSTIKRTTGADGLVTISAAGSGAYTIQVAKSGYQFADIEGEATPTYYSFTHSAVGAAPTITLSGTVKTNSGAVIPTASLTLNGTTPISINPQTGAFSIEVSHGMEYTLTIDDEQFTFMNPREKGTVWGNLKFNYVGFPK